MCELSKVPMVTGTGQLRVVFPHENPSEIPTVQLHEGIQKFETWSTAGYANCIDKLNSQGVCLDAGCVTGWPVYHGFQTETDHSGDAHGLTAIC